ncbi:MAG: hypothetical protein GXY85_04720 [Candidatus Brocadiaceae bacterium]|nr:hypothetical protein [Candidatus Brocadiaceae bacterium]
MAVDLIVVLVVVLLALRGYSRGAIFSLLGLVALAAAWVLSGLLGGPVAAAVGGWLAWSPGVAYLASRLVLCVMIYLPLALLALAVDRRLRAAESETLHAFNRGVGAACGLAWGLVTAFVLLAVADVWVKALPDAGGFFAQSARKSALRKAVGRANPADRFFVTDALKLLRAARRDPEVLKRLSADPRVRPLLEHPDLQTVVEDDELAARIREDPFAAITQDERIGRLLGNRELRRLILSAETLAAVRQASEGGAEPESP